MATIKQLSPQAAAEIFKTYMKQSAPDTATEFIACIKKIIKEYENGRR